MITLREVAARAGVSLKTVSRIVNGDAAVHPKTRAAVQQYLDTMNYVPNQAARMMRGIDSSVCGLMTDVVATTPYSVDIVRGAQTALKKYGHTLLIANSEGDNEQEHHFWRMFHAQRVNGVIYAAKFHRPHDLGQPLFGSSIILANCFTFNNDKPSIIPDDEGGGYVQGKYLLERGHRRIGVLTLIRDIEATRLRGLGIRRAFQEAGVNFDETLDVPGMVGAVGHEEMIAFAEAKKMLSQTNRPTAIICGNDQVAVQVYAAAAHLGLNVPQDLSIMGYDDMTLISKILCPALTTVALPYFEIGKLAVETMRESRKHDSTWAPKILVPCPLVERHSCRALV